MPRYTKVLVRRALTRPAPFYLERGSIDHLGRGSRKPSVCVMAGDLLEPNILGNEKYVAQTKDDWDGGKII